MKREVNNYQMTQLKNITTLIFAPILIALFLLLSHINNTEKVMSIEEPISEIQTVEVLSSEEGIVESSSDVMEFNVKDVADLYVSVVEFKESLDETRVKIEN